MAEQTTELYPGEIPFEEALAQFSSGGEQAGSEPAPKDESVPQATEESQAVAPETAKPAEPAAPALDPKIKELLDREAAIEAKLAKLEEAQRVAQAPKPEPKKIAKFRNWVERIKAEDPDVDIGKVAEELWFSTVPPEKRPAEYKAKSELSNVYSEVEAMRQEVAAQMEELSRTQTELAVSAYKTSLQAELTKLPADKFPLVARLAKATPDKAVGQMMNLAEQAAASQQKVLNPVEAAEALEKWLQSVKTEVEVLFDKPAPTEPAKPQTMWNKQTTIQTPKQAEDELDDDVLRRKAFAAMGKDPALVDKIWRERK